MTIDPEIDASLEDPSDESEDDARTDRHDVDSAVVAATDWTVETLLSQVRRGNVDLNPAFQRRDAWTLERKSRFVESLIAGIPVPQLVLAERRDRRGSYIVIDGKQRLLTLAQYRGIAGESDRNGFGLQRLSLLPELIGASYEELESNPDRSDELNALENSTIRTVVIRNWPSEDYLYLIFHRLNTGSVPLSPQELRQALHPGGFTQFIDQYSFENGTLMRVLGLSRPDFRMRDAELLTRAFAFSNFLAEYSGNLKQFLDDTCRRMNDAWATDEADISQRAAHLVEGMEACLSIFEATAFRRYSRGGYENRFNRAIFDVQMLYMDRPLIREQALSNAEAVRDAFDQIAMDPAFVEATGATTKSITATFARLEIWARKLGEVLGGQVHVPRLSLVGNRIVEV